MGRDPYSPPLQIQQRWGGQCAATFARHKAAPAPRLDAAEQLPCHSELFGAAERRESVEEPAFPRHNRSRFSTCKDTASSDWEFSSRTGCVIPRPALSVDPGLSRARRSRGARACPEQASVERASNGDLARTTSVYFALAEAANRACFSRCSLICRIQAGLRAHSICFSAAAPNSSGWM